MTDEIRPILIVGSQAQKFDFFDAESLEKMGTLEGVMAQPHEVAYDPTRRLAYVGITYRSGGYGEDNAKGHELAVIDVDKHEVVDYIELAPYFGAHDVDYDPATDLIYAGVESVGGLPGDDRNGLVIIDAKSRKVLGNIATKAPNTHWFALSPDGGRAYLAHKEYDAISVLDLRKRQVITEIPTRGGCEEIATSPDGRWAFAATPKMSLTLNLARGEITPVTPLPGAPKPTLIKIDTVTNTIVGRVEFQDLIAAVWVSSEGKVFVTEFVFLGPDVASDGPTPGRINIVDGESLTVLHSVECDELPFTTRTSPDGKRAFVANLKTGTVTVIDVDAGRRIATLESNVGKKMGATHPLAYAPGRPADGDRQGEETQ